MRNRLKLTGFLGVALLASQVFSGGTDGGVKGRVAIDLEGLGGVPLTLVNVSTGQSFLVKTAQDGSYSLSLPSGSYVVSSPGVRGLSIGRAPVLIQVSPGRFASANIEMSRALSQDSGELAIFHNPIGCVSTDEFPVFDTTFEPADMVVSARLFFKSDLSPEWFSVDFQTLSGDFPKYMWKMAPDPSNPDATIEGDDIRRRWNAGSDPESIDPGVPPTHRAFLPKIDPESGIGEVTYYIEVTLSNLETVRTPDVSISILSGGQACRAGVFAAPGGAPASAVTVAGNLAGSGFTAGTTVVTNVVTTVTTLGAAGGAAGAGLAAGGATPTPTPAPTAEPTPTPTPTPAPTSEPTATPTPTPPPATPTPTPTPTPSPTPAPTPSPTECLLQVSVNPPGGQFNPCRANVATGGGNYVDVTSTRTFTLACATGFAEVLATIGPPASFTGEEAAASWSGACTGDAVGRMCFIDPPLAPITTLVLECGCPPLEGFASTCGAASPTPTPF